MRHAATAPTVRLLVIMLFVAAPLVASDEVRAPEAAPVSDTLRATEIAFARTMADRDHAAFVTYLDDETIFFAGERELRGKQAVATAWKPFFDGPAAPFSWKPEAVSVLDSGSLGLTSGPVLDPTGTRVGTFNSVWRRTDTGEWKIVFDRGCPACEP